MTERDKWVCMLVDRNVDRQSDRGKTDEDARGRKRKRERNKRRKRTQDKKRMSVRGAETEDTNHKREIAGLKTAERQESNNKT